MRRACVGLIPRRLGPNRHVWAGYTGWGTRPLHFLLSGSPKQWVTEREQQLRSEGQIVCLVATLTSTIPAWIVLSSFCTQLSWESTGWHFFFSFPVSRRVRSIPFVFQSQLWVQLLQYLSLKYEEWADDSPPVVRIFFSFAQKNGFSFY